MALMDRSYFDPVNHHILSSIYMYLQILLFYMYIRQPRYRTYASTHASSFSTFANLTTVITHSTMNSGNRNQMSFADLENERRASEIAFLKLCPSIMKKKDYKGYLQRRA